MITIRGSSSSSSSLGLLLAPNPPPLLLLNPKPQQPLLRFHLPSPNPPPPMALSSFIKPNPKHKFLFYPSRPPSPLLCRFSSSTNDKTTPDDHPPSQQPPRSPSHVDSFREIKAKIRPNNADAFNEMRKNLAEFRRRSAEPGPPAADPTSLTDLFKKNYANRPAGPPPPASFPGKPLPGMGNRLTVEGSEIRVKRMIMGDSAEELGRRLAELRPDAAERERMEKEGGGGGAWFSLEELRGRLKRLREIEKEREEAKAKTNSGWAGAGLWHSLSLLQEESKKKDEKKKPILKSSLFSPSLDCTQGPPKEHLVEKYFHPDNMSASEKLKIELAKVRNEFKMSESDCGSARVQVAQLTTKIKYLSSVLKKKDKHSLKGLQGMVQQRKKLLKYLRRTDWDSYCLVLDKLGLRDNADFKLRS